MNEGDVGRAVDLPRAAAGRSARRADSSTPDTPDEYVVGAADRVYRLCVLLTGDQHDAADLAQSALEKVVRKWPTVRRAQDVDAYVRRMVLNELHARVRRPVSREVPAATLPEAGIADGARRVDENDRFERLLKRLTTRERTVVVLRYYEDLADSDIAAHLKIRRATVRSTAHRALAKLHAMIDEE